MEDAPVTLEYVPAAQVVHTELEDAPTTPLYVPGGHSMHVDTPVALGVGE